MLDILGGDQTLVAAQRRKAAEFGGRFLGGAHVLGGGTNAGGTGRQGVQRGESLMMRLLGDLMDYGRVVLGLSLGCSTPFELFAQFGGGLLLQRFPFADGSSIGRTIGLTCSTLTLACWFGSPLKLALRSSSMNMALILAGVSDLRLLSSVSEVSST